MAKKRRKRKDVPFKNSPRLKKLKREMERCALQKHFASAIECGQEYLKSDPSDVRVLSGVGIFLGKLRDYEEAIPYLRLWKQKQPNEFNAYVTLSIALCNEKRWEEVVELGREVIGHFSNHVKAGPANMVFMRRLYHEAMLSENMQDTEEFKKNFCFLVSRMPEVAAEIEKMMEDAGLEDIADDDDEFGFGGDWWKNGPTHDG